jgi:hypothetical protein
MVGKAKWSPQWMRDNCEICIKFEVHSMGWLRISAQNRAQSDEKISSPASLNKVKWPFNQAQSRR